MKHIDIVIPTRNRIEKLEGTLDSIPKRLPNVSIIVVCDGDRDTFEYLIKNHKEVHAELVPENKGTVFCRNWGSRNVKDGLLYGTDDIIFLENSIENALECFNKNFPDDDGVVGFVQEGNSFHPTGIALVGQKFLQRYPSKQLFCPYYFHFACFEIYNLCNKLGNKFVQEEKARVFHYHPCNFPDQMDQTHKDARKFKQEDFIMKAKREKKKLIWGYDEN